MSVYRPSSGLQTSDLLYSCDLSSYHVVYIERFPLTSNYDLISTSCEVCFGDGKSLKMDTLQQWITIPINLTA